MMVAPDPKTVNNPDKTYVTSAFPWGTKKPYVRTPLEEGRRNFEGSVWNQLNMAEMADKTGDEDSDSFWDKATKIVDASISDDSARKYDTSAIKNRYVNYERKFDQLMAEAETLKNAGRPDLAEEKYMEAERMVETKLE
jgi:hypothetical protein